MSANPRVTVTLKVELPTYSVREALENYGPRMVEAVETLNDERAREVGRPRREPPKVKGVNVVQR